MNEIVNNFLLSGDKFMPKLHLRQLGVTYSPSGAFTKHRESIQKFKKTGDLNYIYKNELDKACFTHDAAYSDSDDLAKRTVSVWLNMMDLTFMDSLYFSVLIDEIETNSKPPEFKVVGRSRITKYKYVQQSLHQKLVKRNGFYSSCFENELSDV